MVLILAKSLSPIPLTFNRSSTVEKLPFAVFQSMIRPASVGPTPGKVSRSVTVALLRLSSLLAEVFAVTPRLPETMICSPSVTSLARLTLPSSAHVVNPPAAEITSKSLVAESTGYTPGRTTQPTSATNRAFCATFVLDLATAPVSVPPRLASKRIRAVIPTTPKTANRLNAARSPVRTAVKSFLKDSTRAGYGYTSAQRFARDDLWII